MSAAAHGGIDAAALKQLIVASGVSVTSEEVDAVARSLDRIQSAAAALMKSTTLDETAERFYRLLENDVADGPAGE
jgi:hypothetical protein